MVMIRRLAQKGRATHGGGDLRAMSLLDPQPRRWSNARSVNQSSA